MLSTSQKEAVLRKAGISSSFSHAPTAGAGFLERRVSVPLVEIEAAAEHERAVADWRRGIDLLYEAHIAKHTLSHEQN